MGAWACLAELVALAAWVVWPAAVRDSSVVSRGAPLVWACAAALPPAGARSEPASRCSFWDLDLANSVCITGASVGVDARGARGPRLVAPSGRALAPESCLGGCELLRLCFCQAQQYAGGGLPCVETWACTVSTRALMDGYKESHKESDERSEVSELAHQVAVDKTSCSPPRPPIDNCPATLPSRIQRFVKPVEGSSIVIDASHVTAVSGLKALVFDTTGVPRGQQRLGRGATRKLSKRQRDNTVWLHLRRRCAGAPVFKKILSKREDVRKGLLLVKQTAEPAIQEKDDRRRQGLTGDWQQGF